MSKFIFGEFLYCFENRILNTHILLKGQEKDFQPVMDIFLQLTVKMGYSYMPINSLP